MTPRATHLRLFGVALALTLVVAPTLGSTALAATPTPTSVQGWSTSAVRLATGQRTTFPVRLISRGAHRPRQVVLLERTMGGSWHAVSTATTSTRGRARLGFTAPATAQHLQIKIAAARSGRHEAVVTKPRTVVVVAPSGTGQPTGYAAQVLTLVNQARAQARTCGSTSYPAVAAVSWDDDLGDAAQDYATEMATDNFFSHTGPDGSDPGDRITAAGYTWSTWGENIAAGQQTPQDVMSSWLQSPGHCANIMSANFHDLGIGYAADSTSDYGTYWVEDFATH